MEYCERNRLLASVVSAGYGEYITVENDEAVTLPEDWAILRPRLKRIGHNEFPAVDNYTSIRYSGVGEFEVEKRVVLNGTSSGRVEGYVFDCIYGTMANHDSPTRNWCVREIRNGVFSDDGDSGSAVGLDGGLARGGEDPGWRRDRNE